jgi:hypothetical protein
MDQVVDSEAFLIAAFRTGDGPFLPVKVAAADAPFVNVLLSMGTPWQGRPRNVEHSEIFSRMRGETDIFEEMTPISRVPYAFARATTSDMMHAAVRVSPYYHLPTYPVRLSRKKLNTLTGLMTGDKGVVFMFPDTAARTLLTHVIAVSLWTKDPLCAFNLEADPVSPIPLCNVVDVEEGNIRRFATRARQFLADWLRVHPIVVPRPGATSIMEMARRTGITLTESLSAPPSARLLHPPPPSLLPYAPVVGNPLSDGGSASSQPGPLTGNGKVLNRYRKQSSGKEREGEEGAEVEEWPESEGEDPGMVEDAATLRVGTARDFAHDGKERTAHSTENSEIEGSPERGRENGRSDRGERPPELGITHSSTFRSSPTPQSRASLDYNRSRHRNDRST